MNYNIINDERTARFAKKQLIVFLISIPITIFVILFLVLNNNLLSLITGYKTADGVVIDHEITTSESDNSIVLYSEVVEFQVNGKTYIVTNNVATATPFNIGDKVVIRYNIKNPSDFTSIEKTTIIPTVQIVIFVIAFVALILTPIIIMTTRRFKELNKIINASKVQTEQETVDFTQKTEKPKDNNTDNSIDKNLW